MSTYQRNTKEIILKSSVWNVLSDGLHDIVVKDVDFIEKTKGNILMNLVYEAEDGNEYTNIVFVDYSPNAVFAHITRICTEEGTDTLSADDLIGQEFTITLETKGSWQNIVSVMPIEEEEEQPKKKIKKKKKKQRFVYDEDDDY